MATILARSVPSSGRGSNVVASPDTISRRPRISPGNIAERGQRAFVALDRDDAPGAQREQRAGQPAGAGADLDDGGVFERGRGARDARGEVEVEQEILSERFSRRQRVLLDHVAQRRKVVDRAHAGCATAAIRAASRNAAIRLDGLARPVPAMSKAVPWSGEVRMNGKPSVTLTASSNASVLTGIRA